MLESQPKVKNVWGLKLIDYSATQTFSRRNKKQVRKIIKIISFLYFSHYYLFQQANSKFYSFFGFANCEQQIAKCFPTQLKSCEKISNPFIVRQTLLRLAIEWLHSALNLFCLLHLNDHYFISLCLSFSFFFSLSLYLYGMS